MNRTKMDDVIWEDGFDAPPHIDGTIFRRKNPSSLYIPEDTLCTILDILPHYSSFDKEAVENYEFSDLFKFHITISLEDVIRNHFSSEDNLDILRTFFALAPLLDSFIRDEDEESIVSDLTFGEIEPLEVVYLETNIDECRREKTLYRIFGEVIEEFIDEDEL